MTKEKKTNYFLFNAFFDNFSCRHFLRKKTSLPFFRLIYSDQNCFELKISMDFCGETKSKRMYDNICFLHAYKQRTQWIAYTTKINVRKLEWLFCCWRCERKFTLLMQLALHILMTITDVSNSYANLQNYWLQVLNYYVFKARV